MEQIIGKSLSSLIIIDKNGLDEPGAFHSARDGAQAGAADVVRLCRDVCAVAGLRVSHHVGPDAEFLFLPAWDARASFELRDFSAGVGVWLQRVPEAGGPGGGNHGVDLRRGDGPDVR